MTMTVARNYTVIFACLCIAILPLFTSGTVLQAELTQSKLPSPRLGVTLSYDGSDTVYIMGGLDGGWVATREIMKYSISQDTLDVVGQLPQGAVVMMGGAGNDGNGSHFIFAGRERTDGPRGIYRFCEGNESSLDFVSTFPENQHDPDLGYLSLPHQPLTFADSLFIVPSTTSDSVDLPLILEFSITEGRVIGEIKLRLPIGTRWFGIETCVNVGNSIMLFGSFDVGPDTRKDLVLKYDIQEGRDEVVEMAGITPWFNDVSAVADDENAFFFGSYGDYWTGVAGFQRHHFGKNETEFFQVDGLSDHPSLPFLAFSTTLYVPSLNRLYIFGGFNAGDRARDDIWYVDLDKI